MRGGWRWYAVLVAVQAAAWSSAQVNYAPGQLVKNPEGMSGLWETSNGHGGFVGIHIVLGTSAAPDARLNGRTLEGVEQRLEYLNLGVYEQRGAEFVFGDEGYFSNESKDAPIKIDGGRLQLHYSSQGVGTPAVDLDLMKEGDHWVGRFHRGDFDRQVTLERPGAGLNSHGGVAGTWSSAGYASRVMLANSCRGSLRRGQTCFRFLARCALVLRYSLIA